MQELERYSRQTKVSQIGAKGQAQLAESRVLIVGMGGLGSHLGLQLAGAGIGELILLDHDVVDISNLHRQTLYREQDVGKPKALCAQLALQNLNSDIVVSAANEKLLPRNVNDWVARADVVVDAADNFATSYLLSDACLELGVSLVSASVNSTFGYLGVFCGSPENLAPSYRAVFPRLPEKIQNCDVVGVTGPSVGVIASLQAQETIKVLLNDQHQLRGQLLYLDVWNYSQHKIDMRSAQEPSSTQLGLIVADQITATDFVLDVRNAEEIRERSQPFSVHAEIPLSELSSKLDQLPAGRRIVCCCQSGQRALIAAQQLLDSELTDVSALMPS